MDAIYDWLFDNYTMPLLAGLHKSQLQSFEKCLADYALSQDDRLSLTDEASFLQLQMGTEAFALGVQLGIQLTQLRRQALSGDPCAAQ